MKKTIRHIPLIVLALAAALAVAGCGAKSGEADRYAKLAVAQEKNPPVIVDAKTPELKSIATAPGAGEGDIKTKPKIPKQTGAAPTGLLAQDLIKGTGKVAASGDSVSVQYVGVLRDTGKEFDSSWKRSQAFDVTIGAGQVIKGWDQGIVGMKEGGRRRLTIPPDLAYGSQGQPPTIPANATLVFDIDLEKVTPAKKAATK